MWAVRTRPRPRLHRRGEAAAAARTRRDAPQVPLEQLPQLHRPGRTAGVRRVRPDARDGRGGGRVGRAEDVALRRRSRRLPAERVLEIVCGRLGVDRAEVRRRQRGSPLRPIAAKMLCQHAGLTQRQTADLLGLTTGAAVSMQLKSLAAAAASRGKLRKQLATIDKAVEAEIARTPQDQPPLI